MPSGCDARCESSRPCFRWVFLASASPAAAWPGTCSILRRVRTGRAHPALAALGLSLSGTLRVRLQRPSQPREISGGGCRREGLTAGLHWKRQNVGGAPSGLAHSARSTELADPAVPGHRTPRGCPGPWCAVDARHDFHPTREPSGKARQRPAHVWGPARLGGSASSPALPWEFLWRLLPPAIPFYGSWPVAS